MEKKLVSHIIERVSGRFSKSLGINLSFKNEEEIFKWFLASILFGARIGENIVIKTFLEFEKQQVVSPQRTLEVGWDTLVEILDEGGYVRYDFKTATKLLDICNILIEEYGGSLNKLHRESKDPRDLEFRLMAFKGVGPLTTNIFLRELRGIWDKAEPLPCNLVMLSANNLGLVKAKERNKVLAELKALFKNAHLGEVYLFSDFESALIRLGKNGCKKGKSGCKRCPLSTECPSSPKAF